MNVEAMKERPSMVITASSAWATPNPTPGRISLADTTMRVILFLHCKKRKEQMKHDIRTCQSGFYVIDEGPFKGDLAHIGPRGVQAYNPETGRKSWAILGKSAHSTMVPCRVKPVASLARRSERSQASIDRGGGKMLGNVIGGPLNPEWVEWLMGWPIGHTESNASATARSHCARQPRGAYSGDP